MLTTIISSIVAFASTNVDDIFVMMALFSQIRATKVEERGEAVALASGSINKRHIIIGQYLGFGSLVALSIIGALSSFLIPVPWIGLLGLVPIYLGIKGLLKLRNAESDNDNKNFSAAGSVFAVTAITFANGGDNIAIYIPIFAGQSLSENFITLIVFFVMLAVWIFLGYKLVKVPVIANVLEKYGNVAVPIVLIGLGTFILYHSGSFGLLPLN
ncbi:quaternary ammonium transporter [Lysinibacillus sp. FJAT-14745]|uniref:cadmium resistance transporter n=1 Tax=Lysinibacillus sp. FJAT-14745 TaxID=1704289 RepID=UPI0006ABB04F|nr:cadmium resistance transporter [Lysinibacillus sp. FJAT-14745]KOP70204.1 quaternary ammonium transporter [Lysinibacillus sp. FJAT-14745]